MLKWHIFGVGVCMMKQQHIIVQFLHVMNLVNVRQLKLFDKLIHLVIDVKLLRYLHRFLFVSIDYSILRRDLQYEHIQLYPMEQLQLLK